MAEESESADDQISIWERLARPTPSPRTSLTHDQIAAAAIEIADTEGLEAVSIRRLASRLGVAPMALYRYVASKDEIFELMTNAVYAGGVDYTKIAGGWREVLRTLAHGTRATMLRHPWLGKVSSEVLTGLTPNRLRSADNALASLDELDLDADTKMAVIDTVIDYAHGAVGKEVVMSQIMRQQGWQTGDDLRNALAPHMIFHMGTGEYPAFHRWAKEAKRKDDADWRFEFGLECVLDGIAARLGI